MNKILDISQKIDEIQKTDPHLTKCIKGLEDWLLAGRITAYLLKEGSRFVRKGRKLSDISDFMSQTILELDSQAKQTIKLAFPVNISMDDCAAHYSPKITDSLVFDKQIVKLDIGVSVNGALGDSAMTIDLSGENINLVKAAEDALEQAIKLMTPDQKLSRIGSKVESVIQKAGFEPIRNLGGHQMARYHLHSELFVPNIKTNQSHTIKYGHIFAVEPFASTGAGMVIHQGEPEIFMLIKRKKLKDHSLRVIQNAIDYFDGLPFSKRNLFYRSPAFSEGMVERAILEMLDQDLLLGFEPLIDERHGLTSQAEHTVIIGRKPFITTTY